MYFKKVLAFVLCSLAFSEAAFVDTISKCSKNDDDCFAKLIQKSIIDIAETGIPEYNIGPIDPAQMKDVKAKILDIIDITMVEGVVKGIKKCVINNFSPNFDNLVATLDITCDVVVKGKYNLKSSSPLLKGLLGSDDIHGNGNGKVKIEKINIKLDFPYELDNRDGKVYIKGKKDKIHYTFDVLGKVTFAADNLFIGQQESSERIVALMNENWKGLIQSFGKHFLDIAVDLLYNSLNNIFKNVSIDNFVIDDVSSLVKN